MGQVKNKYIQIQSRLDKRSKFFCPAKWTELYLYLNHGNTNSCHHPIPHRIPKELLDDPYVLHNTPFKLQQQQLMVNGQRPEECHMCWHIEDADPNVVSDRFVKSVMWQDQIETLTVDKHSIPNLIEVVFDNLCNLTCSYCDSGQSSAWAGKIHQAPLLLKTDYRNLYSKIHIEPGKTDSQYYNAWLRWWPMIREQVSCLKVSGGEPLFSHHFWNFFDFLGNAPQLEFQLNSNLSVPQSKLEQLVSRSSQFKSVRITVSIDATGAIAEYSRRGLDYDLLLSNIEYWCTHSADNCDMLLQSTSNIFSIWGFADFVELFASLKQRFPKKINSLYSAIVRFPEFQSIGLLPQELKDYLYNQIHQSWQKHLDIFDEESAVHINKVLSYLKHNPESLTSYNVEDLQADLVKFINYYDSFDNNQLDNIFPEIFVNWIKSLNAHS